MIISLPHEIELTVETVHGHSATAISCGEMEVCPGCGDHFCYFDCDCSHVAPCNESETDAKERVETNCRIEGMLSLIQNLHAHGFDHLIEEMGPAIENTMADFCNPV